MFGKFFVAGLGGLFCTETGLPDSPDLRRYALSAIVDGIFYMCGGYWTSEYQLMQNFYSRPNFSLHSAGNWARLSTCYKLPLSAAPRIWTSMPSMSCLRTHTRLIPHNGNLFALTGDCSCNRYATG